MRLVSLLFGVAISSAVAAAAAPIPFDITANYNVAWGTAESRVKVCNTSGSTRGVKVHPGDVSKGGGWGELQPVPVGCQEFRAFGITLWVDDHVGAWKGTVTFEDVPASGPPPLPNTLAVTGNTPVVWDEGGGTVVLCNASKTLPLGFIIKAIASDTQGSWMPEEDVPAIGRSGAPSCKEVRAPGITVLGDSSHSATGSYVTAPKPPATGRR
jgi:hypothetical protein